MDRAELERLDRESLVLRAQAAGIRRARLLTRPELVDELLRLDPTIDDAQLKRTRGFFGRARDLLSRVVERGLHLPDAADRLRAALGNPLPQVARPEPQAVPTVTLAEIYAAQGHKQRAIETLKRVLEAEPDHGPARALLEKLLAKDYVAPTPPLPPETDESARDEIGGNLGPAAQPPAEDGVSQGVPTPVVEEPETESSEALARHAVRRNECVAIPARDGIFVWWQLTAETQAKAAATAFVVRAVIVIPTWDGPEVETRDLSCDPAAGEVMLRDLPPKAVVRVAVGTVAGAAFVPAAHSPQLDRTPANELLRWTLDGEALVLLEDPRAATIARAWAQAQRSA